MACEAWGISARGTLERTFLCATSGDADKQDANMKLLKGSAATQQISMQR